MDFFVFVATDKSGRRICNPVETGIFWVEVGTKEFRWKLPLGSLLPAKMCPVCKERLSGAYKFCPYDGTKLP